MSASLPIVVCEVEKNNRERIRVTLDHFAGRNTIDVRIWYRDGDRWKPTRQGVTTTVQNLPTLANALVAALDRAHDLGLIDRGCKS